MKLLKILLCLSIILCSACTPKKMDYTSYRQSNPRSILVLPPVNNSTEVKASNSLLSQTTYPLSESGYYVMPVALVAETFIQNGLNEPSEIHQVSHQKLYKIFGADAALYINIEDYGTKYYVISSNTMVKANAKLVDIRSSNILWDGSVYASSDEQQNNSAGGLLGMVVTAAVDQAVKSLTEKDHEIAGIASNRLLTAGTQNGLLYGPYSNNYQQDKI